MHMIPLSLSLHLVDEDSVSNEECVHLACFLFRLGVGEVGKAPRFTQNTIPMEESKWE